MAFWGMSAQGKDAQDSLTNLPKSFEEQARKGWGRSEDEFQTGQGLRNDFLAFIREMVANGIGSPQEILALAEQIMPGVSEAIGARQQRTQRLRDEAGSLIPSARDVTSGISGTLDDLGGSITRGYDNVRENVNDTIRRRMAASDAFGRDRVSNIRDVDTGLNRITDEQYAKMSGDVGSKFGGLLNRSEGDFGELLEGVDPAFSEMLKRVEMFKPGGEARAARVGRSFNPAYASVVARLRRSGVDLTSPEAVSALTRVDTARSNAMDDSLAEDTERYVDASNRLSRDKLATTQDLVLQRLANAQGLTVDQLKTQLGLDTDYGNVKRDIGYQTGRDFRDELTNQERTQTSLDMAKLGMDIDNENANTERVTQYHRDRADLIKLGRQLGMDDFQIQTMLEDRANTDDLTAFDLRNQQFDRGMGFRTADLARRDRGVDALGNTSQQTLDNSRWWQNAGSDNAAAAGQGYRDTFDRESANAGWGKKLIGAIGGAAADWLLPGSGSIVRSATGGGGGQQQGSGNLFPSIRNRFGGGSSGASSLPYKTGAPMNPYGGTRQPSFSGMSFYAEGGVVDDPTLAVLGEAGEREFVVPESKAGEFASTTMATGAPPDPSMIGQAPPPASMSKFQLRKLDEAIKAEQTVNKSWDERIRDAMKMSKTMNPEGDPNPNANPKAMRMKHQSDARLERLLDIKTAMLDASMAAA